MHRGVWPLLFAVVIVSFLLPWIGVSCQGQTILTATGVQLLTDDMQTPMLNGLSSLGMDADDLSSEAAAEEASVPVEWRIVALLVLGSAIAGLAVTLARQTLAEQASAALGGLQSIALVVGLLLGPSALRRRMEQAGAEEATADDMFGIGEAMAEMMVKGVKLEFGIGFYAALAASIALVALALFMRRKRAAVVVPEPEEA